LYFTKKIKGGLHEFKNSAKIKMMQGTHLAIPTTLCGWKTK